MHPACTLHNFHLLNQPEISKSRQRFYLIDIWLDYPSSSSPRVEIPFIRPIFALRGSRLLRTTQKKIHRERAHGKTEAVCEHDDEHC